MATTVTGTKTKERTGLGHRGPGFPGPNGKNGNGWKKGGDNGAGRRFSPEKYRITMWVLLAAIVMMFVALSSAYIVLSGSSDQWRPIRMPKMFFLSSGIILLSSATIHRAARSLREEAKRRYERWLAVTLLLGLGFLISQLLGWRELVAQGVYFRGHPHSSFFFLFTGVHGVHLLGGILALTWLVAQGLRNTGEGLGTKRKALVDVVSLYWHVMDGLWIWLFLLLLVWG
jgi:cytochrome c oxidase subunit III